MNAEFKQRVAAWLGSHINRDWDFDGAYGAQCYDLAQFFNQDLVGGPRFVGLYAADIITQAGNKYQRIDNTPEFVPQAGDLMVWNKNLGAGAGHVAVCTGEGDTNYFVSLDQNWNRPTASYVRHTYDNVIGVLRPLVSVPTDLPAPSKDNEGIVNGQGLRGRTEPNTNSSSPWYFDDREVITLLAKTRGQNLTSGPYAPSDWWYLAIGKESNAPRVWVSDAYIRTTKTPANVPNYKVSEPVAPVYKFEADVPCVTEVIPAHHTNLETGNFPAKPTTAVIHDFGTDGRDTIGSTINEFKRPGAKKSAHFIVSGSRIVQMVSLKDRAFHAGGNGNDYVGIETDPAQDIVTVESVRTLLKQLRTKYGNQLLLIKHSSVSVTQCGDDVTLSDYDVTEPPVIQPNPPADPDYDKENNALLKWLVNFFKKLFNIKEG